jgi:hypothetical protein
VGEVSAVEMPASPEFFLNDPVPLAESCDGPGVGPKKKSRYLSFFRKINKNKLHLCDTLMTQKTLGHTQFLKMVWDAPSAIVGAHFLPVSILFQL